MTFQVGDRVRVVFVITRFHCTSLQYRAGSVTARLEPAEGLAQVIYEVNLGDQYPRRYFAERHLKRDKPNASTQEQP
ncbi:MAG: hypothetical protein H7Y22_13490 [Gemmatimonadaceae bacterium]|nr:hypothetical protein [Gloeobacterales cyanobacterium ES-bin-141]